MATLIKLKKVPVKTAPLTKVHSLVEALGSVKEKGFSIVIKSRKELWERQFQILMFLLKFLIKTIKYLNLLMI